MQQFLNTGHVLRDQRALHPAFFGSAKGVQRRAAQGLEAGQNPEGGQHPRAESLLLQLALGVFLRDHRRRQVVIELEIAFKHGPHLVVETAVSMQPCHFILVLVGHQLEQVPGDSLAQQRFSQHRFGLLDPLHQIFVTLGIGRVLVIGQKRHAPGHQVRQPLARGWHRNDLRRRKQLFHRGQIMRRAAAPFKGGFVVVHCNRIELNGAHEGRIFQRNPAFLPGVSQHHRVGVDAVAHQFGGCRIGIEGTDARHTNGLDDFGGAGISRVLPVGVVHKSRCRRAVGIERHMGAALAHAQHRLFACGHDRVAANDQVGPGHADTGGADVVLIRAYQNMAPGGAAFLRQATSVLRDDALALDMPGHAEQLADGDDARAPHTGHHNAPDIAIDTPGSGNLRLRQHPHLKR